ncbi:efflux RND transporter periplasmic adaptor subunit [Pseudodesulfovibrio sp.]|uniref:efflux RND transporter periplasmic adaptor subunit n=1 Tax=unclassified Pseudodesulfovibrio TaxID=2661612 RepID=UPI003B00EC1E
MSMTKLVSRVFLVLLLSCLVLSGCSEKEKKKAEAQQEPTAKPMKVVKVEQRDMPYWAELIGTISAVNTVDVRARVAGFLLKKNFKEGARVKEGELLFVIDPKPFKEDLKQAESGLEYNQALMEKARKDYLRFKKLYEENVVSRDEYESYQTQFATYQAQVRDNSAQVENAKIQLGYTSIYSPIDGIIGRVQVDVGNLVGQGENTLLATVSSVDPVYVTFNITEADYLRARRSRSEANAETHDAELKLILADGEEYPHNGKFDMVDRAVDPRTGTLGIRVEFPNPEGLLRPGQYAKVRLLVEKVKDAVVIPSRAVIDTQGMKSVFKVEEDGKVVNQPLTLGFEQNSLDVVRDGLKPGDMIIVDGIRQVRNGMTIKPVVVPMQIGDDKSSAAPAASQDQPDPAPVPADGTTAPAKTE